MTFVKTRRVVPCQQRPRPELDGETPVDCPENLRADYQELRAELRNKYLHGNHGGPYTPDGLRLRESTICGILAWAVNQAVDDPIELTPRGLTYSNCFELANGIALGTAAAKMPSWMPVAAILVRAHQMP